VAHGSKRDERSGAAADEGIVSVLPVSPSFWLRTAVSLAIIVAIVALALPVAFGGGSWNGGVDASQFF
jgi:hypothetical protein